MIPQAQSETLLSLVQRVRAAVEQGWDPHSVLDIGDEIAAFSSNPINEEYEEIVHFLLHVLSDQDVAIRYPAFRVKELERLHAFAVLLGQTIISR